MKQVVSRQLGFGIYLAGNSRDNHRGSVPVSHMAVSYTHLPNAGVISFTIPENTSPDGIEVSCGDKTLSIDIDFTAGDNISIDLASRTATRNNEQINQAFAPPYQFFTCNEGENQINAYIVIDEQTTAVNGTYTYNARWLGSVYYTHL